MRILLVHNTYQVSGGEETVFKSEKELLLQHAHQCESAISSNDILDLLIAKFHTALNVSWAEYGYKFVLQSIKDFHPDIVHVHNFFPRLTPSIYDACIETGVPVVQTLHNYRIICPGALLMRNGTICEKCVSGSPYKAIIHRCYRNSILGSWRVARMVDYHRKRKTWQNKVNRYITLTEFSKKKFLEAGLSEEKIVVKPNFYIDLAKGGKEGSTKKQKVIYVGRLSKEKGVINLLNAWNNLAIDLHLRIAGDGPLLNHIEERRGSNVELLGRLTSEQVSKEMSTASFLIMPSEWYESFGMVLIEAFAHGLPVVASRLGAMAEIVEDGVTGLHFEPGNAKDLVHKIQWLHDHPEECRKMGNNARQVYEERYTPEKNYEMLMGIYQQVIDENKQNNES
ncbi:glycosyltransferase family 4 protein [Thermodesulfobacteriota bacterium]